MTSPKYSKVSVTSVFTQILSAFPSDIFNTNECLLANKRYKYYNVYAQFATMLFGQLASCTSLRDIEVGIDGTAEFFKSTNIGRPPRRSTMAAAHEKRDWRIFEGIYLKMLEKLFPNQQMNNGTASTNKVYIIDSTTISLCIKMFKWAQYRHAKGAVKIHTRLDEQSLLPDVAVITTGNTHDPDRATQLAVEAGSTIIFDKGYFDIKTFSDYHKQETVFVTRIKDNTKFEDVCPIENIDLPAKTAGVIRVRTVRLTGQRAKELKFDQVPLRLVRARDEKGRVFDILSNDTQRTPQDVADLYKRRWQIELFFKALKQGLHIKSFIGTSENAVKSQIFIAMTAYLVLEYLRRSAINKIRSFKQLRNLIRICLTSFRSIWYILRDLSHVPTTKKIEADVGIQMSLFSK